MGIGTLALAPGVAHAQFVYDGLAPAGQPIGAFSVTTRVVVRADDAPAAASHSKWVPLSVVAGRGQLTSIRLNKRRLQSRALGADTDGHLRLEVEIPSACESGQLTLTWNAGPDTHVPLPKVKH